MSPVVTGSVKWKKSLHGWQKTSKIRPAKTSWRYHWTLTTSPSQNSLIQRCKELKNRWKYEDSKPSLYCQAFKKSSARSLGVMVASSRGKIVKPTKLTGKAVVFTKVFVSIERLSCCNHFWTRDFDDFPTLQHIVDARSSSVALHIFSQVRRGYVFIPCCFTGFLAPRDTLV